MGRHVRIGILLVVLIFATGALSPLTEATGDEGSEDFPKDVGTRSSPYPVWSIGDSYNYTQTHFNAARYNSYTSWTYHEVMNRTTVTTPEGTYDVYGVKGRGQATWDGKPPISDGYYHYYSDSYYRVSDLASVSYSSYTEGTNYYSHSKTYYKPPRDTWDHPVETGEQWNITSTYHYHTWGVASGTPYDHQGDHSYDSGYECLSRGTTEVQAGTFGTYKIRSSTDPSNYSIMYFDAEMGWYVKHEIYSNDVLESGMELGETTFEHGPAVSGESFDFIMAEDRTDGSSVDLTDIFASEKPLNYTAEAPASMNVTIGGDGSVIFRPRNNWYGTAAVTFRADDGTKNSTKDVTVTVTPVNDAPSFDDIDDIRFPEGGSYTGPDLDEHASDVDDDIGSLSYEVRSSEHVSAALLPGNVLSLSAEDGWYGEELIELEVTDPHDRSGTASVSVIVLKINDPPVLSEIGELAVRQYEYLNLTLSGSDADFTDEITFGTNISEAVAGSDVGSDLLLDEYTGELSFRPYAQMLVGEYEVAFWADDGTEKGYRNVSLTVENTNDPPVALALFDHLITDADPDKAGDNNLTVRLIAPAVEDIDGDEITFSWDFGDGTTYVTGRDVNHTFSAEGEYNVTLSMTDGNIETPLEQTAAISVSAPSEGDDGGNGSNGGDGDEDDDGSGSDDTDDDSDDDTDDDDGNGGDGGGGDDDGNGNGGAGGSGGSGNGGGSGAIDGGEHGTGESSLWNVVTVGGGIIILLVVIASILTVIVIAYRESRSGKYEDEDDDGTISGGRVEPEHTGGDAGVVQRDGHGYSHHGYDGSAGQEAFGGYNGTGYETEYGTDYGTDYGAEYGTRVPDTHETAGYDAHDGYDGIYDYHGNGHTGQGDREYFDTEYVGPRTNVPEYELPQHDIQYLPPLE